MQVLARVDSLIIIQLFALQPEEAYASWSLGAEAVA